MVRKASCRKHGLVYKRYGVADDRRMYRSWADVSFVQATV